MSIGLDTSMVLRLLTGEPSADTTQSFDKGISALEGPVRLGREWTNHALAIASFLSFVVLGISISRGADKSKSDRIFMQGASAKVDVIEIIPGRSIGAVALGAHIESLPKGATVGELDGSYMGISFTHKGGKIDDVWIDDLRKIRHPVHWAGKEVSRHAKLKALKELFGPCQAIPDLKGGMAFKCDSGLTLGCDFHGTGSFVQIRLLPNWGGA